MKAVGKHAARERAWSLIFLGSTMVAILFLVTLALNIVNGAFGYVLIRNEIDPAGLARNGVALERQAASDLIAILNERMSEGLVRRYNFEKPLGERSREELLALVVERVVEPHVVKSWSLFESMFARGAIRAAAAGEAGTWLQFRSWIDGNFMSMPQSSTPEKAGIRTAILGSLWTILITVLFAFPVGVGAAVYLEEYAPNNRLTRFIQINIYNLSGVPSIIYGILGLAIFVRGLEPLTGGRTILSAGLTLALLILPVIIINSQEAIRAVPFGVRESSLGVGATKWQTIWHHVLPLSFDRILTGAILAVSRAIGETAPLVVVGASTFIAVDPSTLFSKFTTLPIQIYQWTARPQHAFRNLAAAAIVVLIVLLLSMNAAAIFLRNRMSRDRRTM